ncbi:aminotransferase class V-fold PLP-dependent enzyme [Limibacter armeniacum]|uniref:aminotransferase class V-fold PLP-dependent enzyme n=1 Tax=Limibacter armeniacum TaxID=466084 RepID=UPI002FE530C5
MTLQDYFNKYREQIIGVDQTFETPYGTQKILYADWTASGRQFKSIEDRLVKNLAAFVGNTHTETTVTGSSMTQAYHKALQVIKKHVNASSDDVIIAYGTGMTGVVNKFQRILGLKINEKHKKQITITPEDKPVVFITHMEHHSNQTSWLETIADVEIIPADDNGLVKPSNLLPLLEKYQDRRLKIASVTACSNVTGIETPYHEVAEIMHQHNGLCFVDFACSAPYVDIDMHPKNPMQKLDAIFFSPHKFLGGPATPGIIVFDKSLYSNAVPDNPGGGTVDWTNPWMEHKYVDNIEAREDGGTPGFMQAIKAAFCAKLKDEMGTENILKREKELMNILWDGMIKTDGLHILADHIKERLGIISFYIEGLHHNLAVKLLNDKFGIQVRGGCSCAGTYGHYLLQVSQEKSKYITDLINSGDLSLKPGWVRMSIHPTMTDEEAHYLVDAVSQLAQNHTEWIKDYNYSNKTNEYTHISDDSFEKELAESWFNEPFA